MNYDVSKKMKEEHENLVHRFRSSAFSTLSEIFLADKPNDGNEYISFLGLSDGKRTYRYVRRDYIKDKNGVLDKWNVLLPKAIGTGAFGEKLTAPVIVEPSVGYTQTFVCMGAFERKDECTNLTKYIKTKFLRAMLGVLKITQDCPGPKWRFVPLQDFTDRSDIDWTRSVHEIDLQLYKKYGLTEEEVSFIESKVKEMK